MFGSAIRYVLRPLVQSNTYVSRSITTGKVILAQGKLKPIDDASPSADIIPEPAVKAKRQKKEKLETVNSSDLKLSVGDALPSLHSVGARPSRRSKKNGEPD
jgi:hypothetical protein